MKILSRDFYKRDTVVVAKDLLGKKLVRRIGNKTVSGIIIETEAYRYKDDLASHAYNGPTERNKVMFGQVGLAYVYFTYGKYHCVNAVARNQNHKAGAVLIRALEPTKGIQYMKKNRNTDVIDNLANGPAKLTQALQIDKKQYGEDLTKSSNLFIMEGIKTNQKIISGTRIGIRKSVEKKWNFRIGI